MKFFYKAGFIFVAGVLLSACGQSATLMAPTPVILTYTPIPTLTDVPIQTPAPIVTSIPSATSSPPPSPTPTPFVVFLERAFSVQEVDSVNGHTLRKITGWDDGIHSFEWMDSNHFLLYPIVEKINTSNFEPEIKLFPVAINLSSAEAWLPSLQKITDHDLLSWWTRNIYQPVWSTELDILISYQKREDEYSIVIYNADGDVNKIYKKEILDISPSGTKLLLGDGTWIDLKSGKITKFDWDTDENELFHQVIWSSDETRIYTCCYHFGDAKTGESFSISANNILAGMYDEEGKKSGYGDSLYSHLGVWALNDRYVLSQMHALWDNNPGFIPLFDSSTRTYRDLGKLVGLPANDEERTRCTNTFVSPNGKYILASCYTESYLIDLERLDFQTYPEWITTNMQWSADGDFAWVNTFRRGETSRNDLTQILSVSSKKMQSLSTYFENSQLLWHPTENILSYLSEDKKNLLLLDAQTMTIQEFELPAAFSRIVWHSNGDKIALVAQDGSLWILDYPAFENLAQIMSPIADVDIGNVTWSPDGNSLAFVGDGDVYIVDVKSTP